jgi:hypothetical protein
MASSAFIISPPAYSSVYGEMGASLAITASNTSTNTALSAVCITIPSAGTWRITYKLRGVSTTAGSVGVTGALYAVTSTPGTTTLTNTNLVAKSEKMAFFANSASVQAQATVTEVVVVTTTGAQDYSLGVFSVLGVATTIYSDSGGRTDMLAERIA